MKEQDPKSKQIPGVLVSVETHGWWASKVDREVTRDAQSRWGASPESGRFNKRLINSKQIKDIINLDVQFRNKFRIMTLPWMGEVRLLPGRLFLNFSQEVEKYKSEREKMVESLIQDYGYLMDNAKNTLGSMFRSEDYPSREEVRSRFRVDIRVLPPPSEDQFSKVPYGEAFRNMFSDQIKLQVKEAQIDLVNRLREVCKKLASYKDAKIIQERGIKSLVSILEGVAKLNIFDSTIDQLAGQLIELVKSLDVENLRESTEKKENLANTAREIEAKMAGLFA